MIRLNPIPNARIHASALSALAAAVGLMLISAAPARADHVEHAFAHHFGRVAASHFLLAGELFFGPPVPVPVPVPVVVHREVVYEHPVVYQQPYYTHVVRHVHRHYDGCGHGHGKHHGRGHRKHRGGHDGHRGGWDGHYARY
jgi:hypothetical protein